MRDGPAGLCDALLHAVRQSADEVRARISNVRYAPLSPDNPKDEMLFEFDGVTYRLPTGDYVLGLSKAHDKAIAYMALLAHTNVR